MFQIFFAVFLLFLNSYLRSFEGFFNEIILTKIKHKLSLKKEKETDRSDIEQRIEDAKSDRDLKCPICLAFPTFPVVTKCGHIFCCSCFYECWQKTQKMKDVSSCVFCRAPIYSLSPFQWPIQLENDDEAFNENLQKMEKYNYWYSDQSSFLDCVKKAFVQVLQLILKDD